MVIIGFLVYFCGAKLKRFLMRLPVAELRPPQPPHLPTPPPMLPPPTPPPMLPPPTLPKPTRTTHRPPTVILNPNFREELRIQSRESSTGSGNTQETVIWDRNQPLI